MSQSFINNKPNDFKHILRVLNTNLDGRRQAGIAITAIKGVGRRFATLACKKARVPFETRAEVGVCLYNKMIYKMIEKIFI